MPDRTKPRPKERQTRTDGNLPPPTKPTKREIDDAYAQLRRERPEPNYARVYDYDGEEEG